MSCTDSVCGKMFENLVTPLDSPVKGTFRRVSAVLQSHCNSLISNNLRLEMHLVALF
jgi:hypothetical protein